jgi:hypothetical protein
MILQAAHVGCPWLASRLGTQVQGLYPLPCHAHRHYLERGQACLHSRTVMWALGINAVRTPLAASRSMHGRVFVLLSGPLVLLPCCLCSRGHPRGPPDAVRGLLHSRAERAAALWRQGFKHQAPAFEGLRGTAGEQSQVRAGGRNNCCWTKGLNPG